MSKEGTTNILVEANKIIYGDREKTYGHPSVNLERIAKYWDLYLNNRTVDYGEPPKPLTIQDVCQMMVLLKLARLQNNPDHEDSLIDSVGYLALIERCKNEQVF